MAALITPNDGECHLQRSEEGDFYEYVQDPEQVRTLVPCPSLLMHLFPSLHNYIHTHNIQHVQSRIYELYIRKSCKISYTCLLGVGVALELKQRSIVSLLDARAMH